MECLNEEVEVDVEVVNDGFGLGLYSTTGGGGDTVET